MKGPEQVNQSPELRAALQSLAAVDRSRTASPAVEAHLLAAFRGAKGSAPEPASRRPRWIWAAVAAALLVLALAGIRRSGLPARIVRTPPPAALPPAPVLVPPAAAAPEPKLARVVSRPARPRLRRSAPAPAPPAATAPAGEENEFIPLPFAAHIAPGEALDVVRVQVPRSAMMRFGLPVSADRAWEPVRADLVVGQDGMMRAIRFVR